MYNSCQSHAPDASRWGVAAHLDAALRLANSAGLVRAAVRQRVGRHLVAGLRHRVRLPMRQGCRSLTKPYRALQSRT